jgi:GNAT superfamily N-acetyltransferase
MYSAMGLDVTRREWREEATRMIRDRNGSEDCAVFVVDDDVGTAVACGGVTVATRLPGPGVPSARFGYIQWMVTDPEYRRRGHGKAVFEAILAWLRVRGVTAMELHATPEGEALYRKYGFDDPMYPQLRARLQP